MSCKLITGGAGFIGSCYVLQSIIEHGDKVINLDKLTYAGNLENLAQVKDNPNHIFVHGDIGNSELVNFLLETYKPDAVINFAAESHVDRSILAPEEFVKTNVLGTASLLNTVKSWWQKEDTTLKENFRLLHISTDEVFGALQPNDPAFNEETPYNPHSPYSASKAGSDHLVRSFYSTYDLPILITNCSNNYGPRHFPEKLIPLMILNALANKPLPIYGKGENIRDWLYVEDHASAIETVLKKGRVGESYCVGGRSELNNIQVVTKVCDILDRLNPSKNGSYSKLISYVTDRPGHDFRYAIDCSKIESELGWRSKHNFDSGLEATIKWYLDNPSWVTNIQSGAYREWLNHNYLNR